MRLKQYLEHSHSLDIYTFEQAFEHYQALCEQYSHHGAVKMLYMQGQWIFEYYKLIEL